MKSFAIELVKAENGFWMLVSPGPEDITPEDITKGPRYYIAKDSEEVAEIIKGVAGELKNSDK